VLIGFFLNVAASQIDVGVEHMSYALELLISAVLMTNICQFGYWKTAKQRASGKTHMERWGTVWILVVSSIMSLIMPMAVLVIYVGGVGYPENRMWKNSPWWPNTPHGILFLVMKWVGQALLAWGVIRVTGLHHKIRKRWRALREAQASQ